MIGSSSSSDRACTTGGTSTLRSAARSGSSKACSVRCICGQVIRTRVSSICGLLDLEDCFRDLEVELLVDVDGFLRIHLEQERALADPVAAPLERVAREDV